MAVVPGFTPGQVNNLAQASAGLGVQDKYELSANQRAISSAFQRAQRQYNTGLQTTQNDLALAAKRAGMNLGRNRTLGVSQAAEQTGGYSAAIQGSALASAANRYAAEQAQSQQDYANSAAALQRALAEAQLTQQEAAAELVRDAARRRDYANEIRKYS